MRNISQKFVQTILFNNLFKNRAVYNIMWNKTVELDRPHMKIWRMRIAGRILAATNTTQNMYFYSFSSATLVARTRLNVSFYVHCLSG
jgi:hypothetical protein